MNIIIKNLNNGVKNVIINDPKTYNSLSYKTLGDLIKAFKKLDNDKKVKVIILEGAGKGFCAGHNLNEVKNLNSNELVVHSNPGHTKGSSSFEFPSLGIVFTGDFIFKDGIGRTDLLTGDTNEMIHSINNVFTEFHDDYILYPGHGDKDTVKSIKNNNILVREYLND